MDPGPCARVRAARVRRLPSDIEVCSPAGSWLASHATNMSGPAPGGPQKKRRAAASVVTAAACDQIPTRSTQRKAFRDSLRKLSLVGAKL